MSGQAQPELSEAYKAENKGPTTIAVCWAVSTLSTVFVLARVYTRARILNQLRSDDYFMIISQVCSYISTALSTVAVAYGNGKHMDTLTQSQQEGAILWTTAAFCPGIMSFGFPKLGVIILLIRLLNPGRAHRYFLWALGIWCQLTLFATVGVLLGRCRPARSLWNFDIKGECFDTQILVAYCIYAGSFSAFVDLYLAVYPTIVLYKLQLGVKKKIALCCALGIGSISGIVAIYKSTRIPSLGSPDFSYDTADLVVWTVVEGSTLIIASSIPILQPLMEKILKRNPFSSNKDSKRGPTYYEDYTDRSKSGIELGYRKPKSKAKDDLGLTIVEDDSQENILAHGAATGSMQSASVQSDHMQSHGQMPGNGKILRTNVVTVSYDR